MLAIKINSIKVSFQKWIHTMPALHIDQGNEQWYAFPLNWTLLEKLEKEH